MSASRGILTLLAVIVVGAGAVTVIRQREHHKKVMWAINADLHNLATAQEAYFADNSTYTTDLSGGYVIYHGSIVRILRADATSWEATATHAGTSLVCTSSATISGKKWWPSDCK